MTQKELDYVEDAVGHENNLESIIKESMKLLENQELVSFMEKQLENHNSLQKRLMSLLEDKANEWSIDYGQLFVGS